MERKALGSSTIGKGKQITLPKKVRDILQVDSGDVIVFYQEENGKITIQR